MKILLPIDGSECSESTLRWVADIFNKQTSEYYLIFVMPIGTDFPVVESSLVEVTVMLQKAQSTLEEQGCRVIESEYLLGFPVDRICHYAETKDIELVVMGSHGRSGLSKMLMGSISEGVLEHCKRSVVVFKNLEVLAKQGHPFSHTVL